MRKVEQVIRAEQCRLPQAQALLTLADVIVFRVDPAKITKLIRKDCLIGNDWVPQKPFFEYFVVGGNWDTDYEEVRGDRNYREISALMKYGEKFRESDAYTLCVDELRRGVPQKSVHGVHFKTEQEIDETFSYYLKLISSMRENGYLPILQTSKKTPEQHIGIGIAPSGEFFHFRTGHHRLAIAKQIGLKSVLVHVHFVHSKWADGAVLEYGLDELGAIRMALNSLRED
jgi:hypothetical protein